VNGLHLTADLHGCAATALLIEQAPLARLCTRLVAEAGLTVVGEQWHVFPPGRDGPGGVTGVLLLAESHLAVHTWPERAGVTLDVYVCNFGRDNSERAERLLAALVDAFAPGSRQINRLLRG
jgi:S-adenosylmethionine decarboxylase proenzyme